MKLSTKQLKELNHLTCKSPMDVKAARSAGHRVGRETEKSKKTKTPTAYAVSASEPLTRSDNRSSVPSSFLMDNCFYRSRANFTPLQPRV